MREVMLHGVLFALFLALGTVALIIARRAGFLRKLEKKRPVVTPFQALTAFVLFLTMQLLFVPSIVSLWIYVFGKNSFTEAVGGWIHLLSIGSVGALLAFYTIQLGSPLRWFSVEKPLQQLGIGMLSWTLAFPLMMIVSQAFALVLGDWMGFDLQEQLAVKQIKQVQQFPVLLGASLFMVAFVVPVIEELLFRGYLQEMLLKWLTPLQAILGTSFLFALSHFSTTQGINNLLILSSLFVLSCVLSYLKERQKNLLAPIGLHATFNAISLVQILLIQ